MVSGGRLARALSRSAAAHGCDAEVTLVAARDWASATFVGARFEVAVTLPGGVRSEAWIAELAEVDLPMPRQFARSVRVLARQDAAERIALTVEAVVLED